MCRNPGDSFGGIMWVRAADLDLVTIAKESKFSFMQILKTMR